MVIVITCVIGGFSWVHLIWLANVTVRLLVSDYSQLSDYTVQLQPTTQWLIKYKAVNAPIKFEEIVKVMISNGNRTEWSPIRSVIIRVINKIGRPRSGSPICLITTKFVIYRALFKSKHKKFQDFSLTMKKKSHLSARVMARTVLLNCPIKAEIRAVESQSDLTILL